MEAALKVLAFAVLFGVVLAVSTYVFFAVTAAQLKEQQWQWSHLVKFGIPSSSGLIFLGAIGQSNSRSGNPLIVPALAGGLVVLTALTLTGISFAPEVYKEFAARQRARRDNLPLRSPGGGCEPILPAAPPTERPAPSHLDEETAPQEQLRAIGWDERGLAGRIAKMMDETPVEANLSPIDLAPNDSRYVEIVDDKPNTIFEIRVRLLDSRKPYEFVIDSRALKLVK